MDDSERLSRIETVGNLILDIVTGMKAEQDIPLTRKQAAWYLGVSVQTVDNWREKGILELVVVDGLVGYPLSRLEELRRQRLKGEGRDFVLGNPTRE